MKVDKFRFGVGKGDVAHSSLWVVSQHKNDVYLGVHGQTGHAKVSFHASGWVRFALADRYVPKLATPVDDAPDRALSKWKRPPTPERGAAHVFTLVFPTDYLRGRQPLAEGQKGKPVFWWEPAPAGQAIEVGFFFSNEKPETLEAKLAKLGMPFGYSELPNGEYLSLICRVAPFTAALPEQFANAQARPLSDDLDDLNPAESINSLSALILNDPAKDGVPIIIQASGLSVNRS
ncbi:MAG: hypothetical protein K2P70_19465 [Hyphomonadaceae bacterium]|nr:hypothetical protein [Hyphomonadaceae bacterium]